MKAGRVVWGIFESPRARRGLVIVAAAGLLLRLAVAWQPVSVLLTKNLPDDAYYYFLIAHNVAATGQATFDGTNLTNGFHPLWLLVLVPLFGSASALGDWQVHVALTIASVFDLATIWLVAQIAAELTRREAMGVLAAGLYAFNPIVILQATNGLETALAVMLLTLFWWQSLRLFQQPVSGGWAVLSGAVGGLMFLARTDTVFMFATTLLALLWFHGGRRGLRPAALMCLAAGALVLPWLVWSQVSLGTWFQESGVAVPYAIRERLWLEQGGGWLIQLRESWRQLTASVFWQRGDPTGLPLILGAGLWVLVLAGLYGRWRRTPNRVEPLVVLPVLATGVALILVHAGLRWYPRVWYFAPTSVAFAVCAPLVLAGFRLSPRWLGAASLACLVYYTFAGYLFWLVGLYPWQADMRAAAGWMQTSLPAGTRLASFNAGIYAYYSQHPVINLDGVVNHRAFEAIQNKNVAGYLREAHIDVLVDFDWAIRHEYAAFFGAPGLNVLDELAVLGGDADQPLGHLRVYRIRSAP